MRSCRTFVTSNSCTIFSHTFTYYIHSYAHTQYSSLTRTAMQNIQRPRIPRCTTLNIHLYIHAQNSAFTNTSMHTSQHSPIHQSITFNIHSHTHKKTTLTIHPYSHILHSTSIHPFIDSHIHRSQHPWWHCVLNPSKCSLPFKIKAKFLLALFPRATKC